MKRLLLVVLLASLLGLAPPAAAQRKPEVTIGPFVQFAKDPSKGEVTIVWEQERAGSGWVRYRVEKGHAGGAGLSHDITRRHEVTLRILRPGLRHTYTIGTGRFGSTPIGGGSFILPKPAQAKVSFAVIGDPRAWDRTTRALVAQMTKDQLDLVIGTGDYVHVPDVRAYWERCFRTLGPLIRNVPFFPAVGDHDNMGQRDARTFRKYFVLPGNERYYSFDWGRCHFIALDITWDESFRPDTAQMRWLAKDLEATRGKYDFIFVYGHHPTRTCGHYGGHPDHTIRGRRILPLLLAYGVEFSFAGHDHTYQRWVVDGHTHVVTGGANERILYRIRRDLEEEGKASGELKKAASESHYVLVDVIGNEATVTVRGVGDEVLEQFTVKSAAALRAKDAAVKVTMLGDFEAGEIVNWRAGNAAVTSVAEHATHGKRSLRLTARAGALYPGITADLTKLPSDWSRNQWLRLDVFNPSDKTFRLTVRMDDDGSTGYMSQINMPCLVEPGRNRIAIPLPHIEARNGRRFNLARLKRFTMFLAKADRELTLYFDNIRLERRKAARGPAAYLPSKSLDHAERPQ